MLKIIRQDDAEADITDIWEYGYENWGKTKASDYLWALNETIENLTHNPRIGARCDHIVDGLRRYNHDSYGIYYMIEEDFLVIVRILHHSRDPLHHF